MLPYLLLGIALLVGGVMILRWFAMADPKAIVRVLKWFAIGAIALLALVLVVSGRLAWAIGAVFALSPWLIALMRNVRTAKNYARMAGIGGGQASTVETRFLRMSLDHQTGDLDGEVREGPYQGRRLTDMAITELLDLLRLCRQADSDSAQVLLAFLDRCHPEWVDMDEADGVRDDTQQHSTKTEQAAMSVEEAYRILGVEPGASKADIKAAYHRLIASLHPDKGGSSFLAAQVNRAREVLLGR